MGRVEVLEQATATLLEGTLHDDLRHEAEAEAHKVAGLVGTFGYSEGSLLTREMERMFRAGSPLGQEQALHLSKMVAALRRTLEQAPFEQASEVMGSEDQPLV